MRILSYNSGHDGAAVLIQDGRLVHSLENEKDDGVRNTWLFPSLFVRSLQMEETPDVVAITGIMKRVVKPRDDDVPSLISIESGYFDESCTGKAYSETLFAGRTIRRFSSSHVRSHIMCAYGLSPFSQGQPCYVLVWEGVIGAMYRLDENVNIQKIGDVISWPGTKYSLLYALADSSAPPSLEWGFRFGDAGKLMALAAYGRNGRPTPPEQDAVETIMSLDLFNDLEPKKTLSGSRFFNVGVESQELKDLAWQFSSALFDRFYLFAKQHMRERIPLLIVGGCGLNCEWNSRWRQCGLFPEVFVPPCANDSGVAIGTAIDALHHFSGRAKVEWNVYGGEEFVEDVQGSPHFFPRPLSLSEVARALLNGAVVAWIQGRYEIGPRALGNRSLLATPFSEESRDKLNRIKQRESYRPIAPICLAGEFASHFEHDGLSPHMLYFQRVKNVELRAVTHVDGSARAQSVTEHENPEICALLKEFRLQSGVGVLCNTSLNFKGHGFINRLSHLFSYAHDRGVDCLVVGDRFWQSRALAEKE